jgi:hypothetical protein
MPFRIVALSAVLLGLGIGQVQAQYYPPPPRGYGYGYGPPGGQCDAFLRTPYGPRRVVCPMGRPRPVGAPCACPPPGPYAPPAHGHVIP